ncbi:ras-GEF domain-containing family member 1B isoform X2 [Anopheles gambiae]|uniref:ras-GEF domain-containing family member 1B isoform X2 n=1 Tax=Anopheles gambiae TaxID=7165 RepID=UPI002AC9156D|nr:ras-GEF domain-containing family member 1B isoform X2 [Anopheles gambiae]
MNSTTVPTATAATAGPPKKPPVPVKPRSIPPPPNPHMASTAQHNNTPKGGIRTSLLAQRLEETLRLGLGELDATPPGRLPKLSAAGEDGKLGDGDRHNKKPSGEEHNLQAALQAEMRRQCGSIKARFLLERRLPQNGCVAKDPTGHDPALYAKADDLLLHYTEGNLISGTLEGLLTHFTPTGSYLPDRSFIFTFLLAARQFLRPDEILERTLRAAIANGGTANLPHLLAAWMNDFPYDFRDERMMRLVRSFTEQQSAGGGGPPPPTGRPHDPPDRGKARERSTLSRALRRLAHRLAKLERYEVEKGPLGPPAKGGGLDDWKTAPALVELASGSPVLMANTLTAIEAERFSFIGLEEFFPPSGQSAGASCYRGTGPTGSNLLAYVQWYNRLTYVVATDILRSPRKRHRARAVEFWIETGRECFNRGNFNSLMAIIATLTGGPIGRLKKTWTKVTSSSSSLLSGMTSSSMISSASGIGNSSSTCSSAAGGGRQQLAILEHQADPTNNFATYRATLHAAAWRSCPASARSSSTSSSSSSKSSRHNSSCSSDDGQGPTSAKKGSAVAVLPFFSLLLKDLHFLNETSGSSILPNGHINFDKWRQLGERLSEVRRWQRQSSYQRRCRVGRRHKSVTSAEVAALRDAIERGPTIGDRETAAMHDASTKASTGRDQLDAGGGGGGANDDGERGAAALAKVSYEREAPEGAVEKSHWKSLQQYHA